MDEMEKKETEGTEEIKAEKKKEETPEEKTKKEAKDLKKELNQLKDDLATAEKKAAETEEKYLRMLAEYDNFRKRTAKEREGIYSDAYADALKEMLPVLDNLERADACKDAEGIAKGIELTLRGFRDALGKLGVSEIDCLGESFDPNFENAVMHVEDEEHGEGEVVEVLMKGYKRDDKVIRYAMVKVAN